MDDFMRFRRIWHLVWHLSLIGVLLSLTLLPAAQAAPLRTRLPRQVVPPSSTNDAWTRAQPLQLQSVPGELQATAEQSLDRIGESRWYRFQVIPGSQLDITLTNLPAPYELAVYKDIAAAYDDIQNPQDLNRLGAEFAPDAYSPDAYSPDAYSPDAYSPDAYSPDAYSPDAYSPDAYSPDAYSPDAYSPDAYSPDAYSPDAYSPDAYSPDAYSPDAYSPDAYSPDPQAYASAQQRSLLGVSAFEGTGGQGLRLNSWNNTGNFYVRVRGRNGASLAGANFLLTVRMLASSCPVDASNLPDSSTAATRGGYRTIILTNLDQVTGTADQKLVLEQRLAALAARPEVAGVIVPVAADARVSAAQAQAANLPTCPYAKNLVAESIKQIIDAYWAVNPLEYVVVIGNDSAIPFFRYPDLALLAGEKNFIPPVRDATSSQASLRLNYVLGQDAYGSAIDVSLKTNSLPIANLAVGRLVETAPEIVRMLDAYLATSAGVVPTPQRALVTGYDFLEDAALAVEEQFTAGLGQTGQVDSLIAWRDWSPADPRSWTASDLRAAMFGSRHDLLFLAGHFSESSALAADYSTRLTTQDLIATTVDLQNAIVLSPGCHSGYNLVNEHGITGITRDPDWAQAFARKGTTLVAGTGYQYGDTDFIFYSERLYLELSRQLRTGSGPVAIGKALTQAKLAYLATTAPTRGVFEKSYLVATLFGLPMLQVNMPGARLNLTTEPSVVTGTSPVLSAPGQTLGLATADLQIDMPYQPQTVRLRDVQNPSQYLTATYLQGRDGVMTQPAEPVLPLELRNVSVPGQVLRGVGFRGGRYQDFKDIRPLTGGATSEVRAVRPPFQTSVFYPVRPWSVNYYDTLDGAGATRLVATPAQFISDDPAATTGRLRWYSQSQYRLFYSNNISSYGSSGNRPALSAAPAIVYVAAHTGSGNRITFQARVTGDPSAGIQQVWITYTGVNGGYYGTWASCDLVQSQQDSTLWESTFEFPNTNPQDLRFMVQAVNGVGLVALAANQGDYYRPDLVPGAPVTLAQAPTSLVLNAPANGVYGMPVALSATLTSAGQPLANQVVQFSAGAQRKAALTNASGVASVALLPLGLPGTTSLRAAFAATVGYQGAATSGSMLLTKQPAYLVLSPAVATVPSGGESGIVATLTGGNGRPLGQQTIMFIVTNGTQTYTYAEITDYTGHAPLGTIPLPVGSYDVRAYFLGTIPLPAGATSLDDPRYLPATAISRLVVPDTTPPITTVQVTGTKRADCPSDCFIQQATVTLTANEPATIRYRIRPEGGSWGSLRKYTTPFVVSSEGLNTIEFYGTDTAGNREATRTATVKITKAPSSPVRDQFNRANGGLGSNWQGAGVPGYQIQSNQVVVSTGGPAYWKPSAYGTNQEAYLTIKDVRGPHLGLLLKVQSGQWEKGTISVFYNSDEHSVGIETYTPANGWVLLQKTYNVTMQPGDLFAAQALSNGKIKVYRNCQLIATTTTATFRSVGGQIGIWFYESPGAQFDSFGGGTAVQ